MSSVINHLNQFHDPRDQNKIKHPLSTILFISICSTFSGAESWEDMVLWAETHTEWLSKYVNIDSGIPSYSTIRRLFTLIKPSYWGQLIHQTILEHHPNKKSEDHIPIDGKTLRGSKCGAKDVRAIQMVSALSVENNIVLGEVKTDCKSNEITAIPLLLALLDLEGATVSIDAMGCNEKIISNIL
ncbi:ISAs1 family transposase, partial [uncultured Vibrio sp.]|uniref:ISAs1 family transposase n=1 Tax=uncultured Vibrio sp. TaxID=114054 RepID=UPI002605AE37